jgi:hypothetical protein
MRYSHLAAVSVLFFLAVSLLAAEPKKAPPKELPRVVVVTPLGIAPGAKTRLVIRGLRLENATEVRCQEPKATAKVLKKSKVGVPNQQDVNRVGDTQVEAEVTLPADYPNRTVTISVLTAAGESQAHSLLIDRGPVVAEKEPNNGFRQAQPIQLSQEVQGSIEQGKDVDLYRFEGKEGQRITLEVLAARYGSALDSLLTLYDGEGQVLASCDDISGSSDSRLDVTLPKTGTYFVSVIDANDQNGPAHVYRLSVRFKSP